MGSESKEVTIVECIGTSFGPFNETIHYITIDVYIYINFLLSGM